LNRIEINEEKIQSKRYSMREIILEGVLQTFDNKHNGRIYPEDFFTKAYKESVRKLIRKKKIKKIFNV
jgi:hypothetical protein